MRSVPEGGMLSEGGIGVGLKLNMEGSMLNGSDGRLRSGRCARPKVEALSCLSQPAFERAKADGQGGDHVLAWPATGNCREDALA